MNDALPLLAFLALLPLLNAPLGWLSLGFSRGLLHAIRDGYHGPVVALAMALLDVALAIMFLLGITLFSTAGIAVANALAVAGGGAALVDLPDLFGRLCSEPTHIDHWWIYAMLFSTLLPTLIHFTLAGSAAMLAGSNSLREKLASNLQHANPQDADTDRFWSAWVYLTFVPALGLLLPVGLFWLLWLALPAHGDTLLLWVLNTAQSLGGMIDPSLASVSECRA